MPGVVVVGVVLQSQCCLQYAELFAVQSSMQLGERGYGHL